MWPTSVNADEVLGVASDRRPTNKYKMASSHREGGEAMRGMEG